MATSPDPRPNRYRIRYTHSVDVTTAERAEIAGAMRSAISSSGLRQGDFARAIGTSRPRLSTYASGATIPNAALYLRATTFGADRASTRELGLADPDAIAERVNRGLAQGDETWALRLILRGRDDLRAALGRYPEAAGSWACRGREISDARFDGLYAALVAHEFDRAGRTPPRWSDQTPLPIDWVMNDPFRDEPTIRAQTQPWLARQRIFIAEKGLTTA